MSNQLHFTGKFNELGHPIYAPGPAGADSLERTGSLPASACKSLMELWRAKLTLYKQAALTAETTYDRQYWRGQVDALTTATAELRLHTAPPNQRQPEENRGGQTRRASAVVWTNWLGLRISTSVNQESKP